MDAGIIENVGSSAIILSLFIIWKLVEEVLRFQGIKRYRKATGDNPGHGRQCRWTLDDHKWLSEIRDNTKNNKKIIMKLETFLDRELNK